MRGPDYGASVAEHEQGGAVERRRKRPSNPIGDIGFKYGPRSSGSHLPYSLLRSVTRVLRRWYAPKYPAIPPPISASTKGGGRGPRPDSERNSACSLAQIQRRGNAHCRSRIAGSASSFLRNDAIARSPHEKYCLARPAMSRRCSS